MMKLELHDFFFNGSVNRLWSMKIEVGHFPRRKFLRPQPCTFRTRLILICSDSIAELIVQRRRYALLVKNMHFIIIQQKSIVQIKSHQQSPNSSEIHQQKHHPSVRMPSYFFCPFLTCQPAAVAAFLLDLFGCVFALLRKILQPQTGQLLVDRTLN